MVALKRGLVVRRSGVRWRDQQCTLQYDTHMVCTAAIFFASRSISCGHNALGRISLKTVASEDSVQGEDRRRGAWLSRNLNSPQTYGARASNPAPPPPCVGRAVQ